MLNKATHSCPWLCTAIGLIKSRQVRCPKPRCSAVKQAPEQLVLGNWHMFHVLAATVGLLTFLASYCSSTSKQRYNGSCHSSFDYLYPKSESKEKSCANICFTLDSPTLYFAFVLSRLGYVICPLVYKLDPFTVKNDFEKEIWCQSKIETQLYWIFFLLPDPSYNHIRSV